MKLFTKFITWYVIGYLFLAGAMALGFYLIREETHAREAAESRRAYELCEATNKSRQASKEGFGFFTDALVAASIGQAKSEAQRQDILRRTEIFKKDLAMRLKPLAPRDCKAEP